MDRLALNVRPYRPSDRAACMAVFNSNVGGSFIESERAQFARYLDELPGPYFVVEDGNEIIACGGFAPGDDPRTADLCWGMVRYDRQRSGIGNVLTTHRIEEIRKTNMFRDVMLRTSQDTEAFYERLGFKTERIVENGIAPGMDTYEMRLHLQPRSE
jgi:ribosomal protein S18 acetylase RimI-like enzyme